MQTTFALAAAFAGVAYATGPAAPAPAGFVTTYPSSFQITAVNSTIVTAKRDIAKRSTCPTATGSLVLTLKDGVLTDTEKGYIADIVSNHQFQFDPAPGQPGYIYNSGFSVGSNSSLALGDSAIFYQCLSGGFYNLYSESVGSYCEPILIDIIPCGDGSSGEVTQASDGQPAATGVVTQTSDGQPQAQSATPVISQISDAQPQAHTAIPITQISDGQPQIPTAVISQISDGQPQAPTTLVMPAPITQISDAQPQAPTATPSVVISQISDAQPQAPTSTLAVITQISDAQPQAPSATPSPSSNGTAVTSPTPTPVLASGGNAVTLGSGFLAAVAGLVVALL